MLGHSMGTLRLSEILREVRKHGHALPEKFVEFTASQVGSEAIS